MSDLETIIVLVFFAYWCCENTSVMETGRNLAIEEEDSGVTLACLQQAGKLPRRKIGQNTTLRRRPEHQQLSSEMASSFFDAILRSWL